MSAIPYREAQVLHSESAAKDLLFFLQVFEGCDQSGGIQHLGVI
jgi:hypothetical protein